MKTTAKHFTSYENIGLVQFRAEPESIFTFKPGGPAMQSGELVITESNESGVVGKLFAVNTSGFYLLLTDADVLIGAKQNRIINKSMLLAPGSKTLIDVSCIERLRWNYTSKCFSSPGSSADHDLRKAKAAAMSTLRKEGPERKHETQYEVWSHINARITEENFSDKTESYHEFANFNLESRRERFPECHPEAGCNGVAVVANGKVQCIDLFGSEEVYRYYFPMLRDSAFGIAGKGRNEKAADMHEAYFKVLDTIDQLETIERKPDNLYTGTGLLTIAEKQDLIGFELTMEEQLVHQAVFMK